MKDLSGKKLLVLGGKPIGSREIVNIAREMGIYTIVADYLPMEKSPAKKIADEVWNISTSEIEKLAEKSRIARIDGVYSGVHEFNILQMIKLCRQLNLPCFCTEEQWTALENKEKFKKECRRHHIPVAAEYQFDSNKRDSFNIHSYPVVVKPADGSGSRGFSICNNVEEVFDACEKAKLFSDTGTFLIEQYMDYRYSVIINYTLVDGHIYYSGMSDKRSRKVFDNGAPIMSFQRYPSDHERRYLEEINGSAILMLKDLHLKNGVIWIEAFYQEKEGFVFNELGFRFGGSLTYYPIKYYYGIDQLELQIEYALTGKNDTVTIHREQELKKYCILPIHVKPGRITDITGINELREKPYFHQLVFVHEVGDDIELWGSAQQVFAYIHFLVDNTSTVEEVQSDIMRTVHVLDAEGNEMLFNLFDATCI